jgi:RTX toxin acyltransferase family protein
MRVPRSSNYQQVAEFLQANPKRQTLCPVGDVHQWLLPPYYTRQLHVCLINGSVYGYMTWAFLGAKRASEMLYRDPQILHGSEWNEGLDSWIIHAVASTKFAVLELGRRAATLAREYGQISYVKYMRTERVCVTISYRSGKLVRKISGGYPARDLDAS